MTTTTAIPLVDQRAVAALIAARLNTLNNDVRGGTIVRHRHERPGEDPAGTIQPPAAPADRAQIRLIAIDSVPARTSIHNDVRRLVISLAVSVPESLIAADGGRLDTAVLAIAAAFERQRDADAHQTVFYETVSSTDNENPELPGHAQALVIIEASAHRSSLVPPPP